MLCTLTIKSNAHVLGQVVYKSFRWSSKQREKKKKKKRLSQYCVCILVLKSLVKNRASKQASGFFKLPTVGAFTSLGATLNASRFNFTVMKFDCWLLSDILKVNHLLQT